MEERRQESRANVSFPVECIMLPERKKIFYSVSKDLSKQGARILYQDFLPKGKDIKVNINLIEEIAQVKAKVMWCNKTPYPDRYYVGLKFMEINEKNKSAINYFLNKITPD